MDVASPAEVTEEKKELANDDNEPADAASEEEDKEEVKPAEKETEEEVDPDVNLLKNLDISDAIVPSIQPVQGEATTPIAWTVCNKHAKRPHFFSFGGTNIFSRSSRFFADRTAASARFCADARSFFCFSLRKYSPLSICLSILLGVM